MMEATLADESPLPISVNAMSDDELQSFVVEPKKYLAGVDRQVIPSPFTLETKDRIKNILGANGIPEQDFQNRLDIYATVKVKNIEIIG
jgi:hypothetical protein